MRLIRIIGFALLGIAACVVVVATAPDSPKGGKALRADVATALVDWEANESSADSAPQQNVTTGWAAKDLLTAIGLSMATQRDETAASQPDDRLAYLLVVGVLAICWLGATTPSMHQSGSTAPLQAPGEPGEPGSADPLPV